MTPISHSTVGTATSWEQASAELAAARLELSRVPAGIARQGAFNRALAAGRQCTGVIHEWLARSFGFERVDQPRMLFSLDVDGVLEDWFGDFSATGITGAAALRLLQLGGVAVVLNTAHSLVAVEDRVHHFHLMGAVSAFGGMTLDAVFDRGERLVSDRADHQLSRLRGALRSDAGAVLDPTHQSSVRVSRIVEGQAQPIIGRDARQWLDRLDIFELSFWVAPHYTDFVDRKIDKGIGIEHLRQQLGLSSIPLSAMGDGACDVPMLSLANPAFVPAATLPNYSPPRRQRLVRSHFLGADALWDAACQLVPSSALQRQVVETARSLEIPDWFPESLRPTPPTERRRFARLISLVSTAPRP